MYEESDPKSQKILYSELMGTEKSTEKYQNSVLLRAREGGTKIDVAALRQLREDSKLRISDSIESNLLDSKSDINSSIPNPLEFPGKEKVIGSQKKWKKFSIYLEVTDKKQFDNHLDSLLNLIESFEKLLHEEKFDLENEDHDLEIAEEGKMNKMKVQNFTNVKQMFNHAKENAFKNDSFPSFLGLLQKMQLIPVGERGKEIWISLDNSLSKLIGGQAEDPGNIKIISCNQ
jgi:hypothetical protein